MLSILPREDTRPETIDVYQIVIMDPADDLPVRRVWQLPAPRPTRKTVGLAGIACSACVGAGFVAALLLVPVPPPPPPVPQSTLTSVTGASVPRVEPLLRAAPATPALAGWVGGVDRALSAVDVKLLPASRDRRTVAIELHSEPRMVALRGISSRAFEVELGEVAGIVTARELVAPDDVDLVRRVTIGRSGAAGTGMVRIRVMLDGPAQGNVRVVGRTVYADFVRRPSA
jgi:hypothetical protein